MSSTPAGGYGIVSLQGQTGYVYVIHDGEFYKIGITYRLESRIRSLRTASGRQLQVIMAYLCEDPRKHERSLHRYFAPNRTLGEWFKLDWLDLDSIETYFENSEVRPIVLNYRKY